MSKSPFSSIRKWFTDQRNYFAALPLMARIILCSLIIVQTIYFLYLICTLPYHYDEGWSYIYFSRRGIWSSMTQYPAPNNHVFFNVVASMFVHLPIDPVITFRLPNVLAGILAIWFFFKLSRRILSVIISLITTVLFTTSFPSLYYASVGRGYGMLLFFAVLSLYSIIAIIQEQKTSKYLVAFAISSILGFFTIPSFLYFFAPVACILFVHIFVNKQYLLWRYIVACISIVIGTLLLYYPIIQHNGWHVLVNNNGIVTRTPEYIREHAVAHFASTWDWLIGKDVELKWIFPLIAYLLFTAVYNHNNTRKFIALLSLAILMTPIAAVFMQKVIPFERTWCHIVIFLAMIVGTILEDIAYLLQRYAIHNAMVSYILLIAFAGWYMIANGRYFMDHRKNLHKEDYITNNYGKLLYNKLDKINDICFPDENLNFYLAEDIQFECYRKNKNSNASVHRISLTDIPSCDLLVFQKGNDTGSVLSNYVIVPYENDYWQVYVRKDL